MNKLDDQQRRDLLSQEFLFEHGRADVYIERNYHVLAIWAAALAAIITIGMNKEFCNTNIAVFLLFATIIPTLNFLFAVIYAYNTYANMLCGLRAEVIHKAIFSKSVMLSFRQTDIIGDETKDYFYENLPKYILSKSWVSAPMYISLIVVILGSSAFGYYYAYVNCPSYYIRPILISLGLFIAFLVGAAIPYVKLHLDNDKKRENVKKEK